jgi:hypothetical protein
VVEPVDAPDREHVRGVAPADEKHVLSERELAQVVARPREERQVRQLALPAPLLVEVDDRVRPLADSSRHVADLSPTGLGEQEVLEAPDTGFVAPLPAADRDDRALRHRHRV